MEKRNKPFAKRSLGQNFLIDDGVIRRIAASLELKPDETVVEIGSGRGALTNVLPESAGKVIAIEFDRDLVPLLHRKFGERPNFELLDADALQFDFSSLSADPIKLAANLPYNISTAILQRLMDQRSSFSLLILMFQREVVDRITAKPGEKERGFLSVLAERYFETKKLFDVPGHAFRPVPKVWSTVVRLIPKSADKGNDALFRRVVSMSFAQKRKTIFNNLKGSFPDAASLLATAGIEPMRRAETLSQGEWESLADAASSVASK